MLELIRVAAAVPAVTVGNVRENVGQIIAKAEEADKKQVQLTVFPELALTGYTCADLFFQKTLLEETLQGLRQLLLASRNLRTVLAVGLPLAVEGKLYNCAAILQGGRLYGVVPKTGWFPRPFFRITTSFTRRVGLRPGRNCPVRSCPLPGCSWKRYRQNRYRSDGI